MEVKDGGILILSGPRTGSTNLMKSLGSYYNKKTCMEYDLIRKYPHFDSSKDVLKYVPLRESNYDKILNTETYKDILNKAKEFKTIILLDRKNKKEQLESYYVLKKYQKGNVSVKWRDEEINKTDTKYKQWKSYINSFTELFKMISKDLKLPIDFYEDVYKNNSLTNKNIKLDLEYFKPNYKLRQEIKPKRLV